MRHGYPESYFVALPNDSRSTRDEAAVVLAALAQRRAHRVDIVTSDYHTRRAGNIYRALAHGVEIHMVAAPDQYFSARWLVEESRRPQDFFAGMDEDCRNLAGDVTRMKSKAILKSAWPYLWKYRRGIALGMGALLANDILKAALPLAIRGGIDSLMGGFRLSLVFEFAALVVLLSLVKGVFQYWMRVILIGISRDIEFDLRNDLFSHLVTLSQDFYGRYRTGDIMARATNDLNAVRMMLGPGIMYFTETFFTAVFLIGVMGRVDWRLTLFCLIPAPLVSVAVVLFGTPHSRPFRKNPENVLRHQQPRAGEFLGRACGSRLCAGAGRDPQIRAAEPGLRGRRTSAWRGFPRSSCRCCRP